MCVFRLAIGRAVEVKQGSPCPQVKAPTPKTLQSALEAPSKLSGMPNPGNSLKAAEHLSAG